MLTQQELKTIENHLAFYASPRTWRRRGAHEKGEQVRYSPAPFTKDHGDRARRALEIVRAAQRRSKPGLFARLRRAFKARPVDLGYLPPASRADASEA